MIIYLQDGSSLKEARLLWEGIEHLSSGMISRCITDLITVWYCNGHVSISIISEDYYNILLSNAKLIQHSRSLLHPTRRVTKKLSRTSLSTLKKPTIRLGTICQRPSLHWNCHSQSLIHWLSSFKKRTRTGK